MREKWTSHGTTPRYTNLSEICTDLFRVYVIAKSSAFNSQEFVDAPRKAGYPEKMVKNITTKVLNLERDISIKEKGEELKNEKIMVVSTFQADETIVEAVKESEENFKRTQSFRTQQGPLFQYVKKVGPSLRSQLNSLKQQALGTKRGSARMCNGPGCKTCQMLIRTEFLNVGKKKNRTFRRILQIIQYLLPCTMFALWKMLYWAHDRIFTQTYEWSQTLLRWNFEKIGQQQLEWRR